LPPPPAKAKLRGVAESVVERELAIRLAAQAWLDAERAHGHETWTQPQLADFHYRGEHIALMDPQRGIRKPASMAAALSIRTVHRSDGVRPYDDGDGPDGLLRYMWRGDDPAHPENVALREAMVRGLPLIWFLGFAQGLYTALYPVYLVAEEPAQRRFVVAVDEAQRGAPLGDVGEAARRYAGRLTRQRLHQRVFRAGVMHAYATHCAVCALGHDDLLDAAHIIADADDRGDPVTSNGLALCKIHHAAFDANILGIRPDLTVCIRHDVLHEVDGPMLRHGLQEHHDRSLLVVPHARRDRPDRGRLEERYARFLAG
jgi:putative restriction endonuclease